MTCFKWIANHKTLILLLVSFLGIVCQIIRYRHLKDGRFKSDDLGYFFRLYRTGDTDGRIMIYATATGVLLAFILIVSLLMNVKS